MGSGQESIELTKAARLWMQVLPRTEMPPAKHAGDVACLFQYIRQRNRSRIEAAIQLMAFVKRRSAQ